VSQRSILFVVPSLDVGGSERYVAALSGALAADGRRVTIVCLRHAGRLAPSVRRARVTVEALELGGVHDPRVMFAIHRVIREQRPHVVHAFLGGFDVLAALPARRAGVATILGSRRELAWWMRARHRLVERLGSSMVDRIVCCSDAVRRHVLANEPVSPAQAVVARTGIDLAPFAVAPDVRDRERRRHGLGSADVAIVTVANFDVEKGHEVVLRAARRLLRGDAPVRFLWAGVGPLRANLERQATAERAAGRVRFLGHVDDVPALLSAADLFVLGSHHEGLPHAVLEAMAAGLPVVATRAGGVAEVVSDGVEGRLVTPGDDAALADAVAELVANRDDRLRLASAARARARREHGLEGAVARYLRVALSEA